MISLEYYLISLEYYLILFSSFQRIIKLFFSNGLAKRAVNKFLFLNDFIKNISNFAYSKIRTKTMNNNTNTSLFKTKDGKNYLLPFIVVTLCFALWGFANDITNPMVKSFSKIFRMSVTDGALVQVAFYGGYFAMAFPSAMFIKRFSYKKGILLGLGLYAFGALMFIPASWTGNYYPFLIAYFILTCGLSFLETSANPFILSMGESQTATRRLNFAQSFNPIGSLAGMFVAMNFIQAKMNPLSSAERAQLNDTQFEIVKQSDLAVLIKPYVAIGIVLVIVFIVMALIKIPKIEKEKDNTSSSLGATLKRLLNNKIYREGVITQFFYVGAQITCWTFIIQYGTRVFMNEGMSEQAAEIFSQKLNIVAMVIFCLSRFVGTYLMKYFKPSKLLSIFAVGGFLLVLVTIFANGRIGVYSLVGVSACMSLMFPTIYGLALGNVGQDTEVGSAGLIMAILGGSVLPAVQAMIIDQHTIFSMPAVNISFIVPLICFVFVFIYGVRCYNRVKNTSISK